MNVTGLASLSFHLSFITVLSIPFIYGLMQCPLKSIEVIQLTSMNNESGPLKKKKKLEFTRVKQSTEEKNSVAGLVPSPVSLLHLVLCCQAEYQQNKLIVELRW